MSLIPVHVIPVSLLYTLSTDADCFTIPRLNNELNTSATEAFQQANSSSLPLTHSSHYLAAVQYFL